MSATGNLLKAALSDPRQVRLIFSYVENGQCVIDVQSCFNSGAMTFELNGDTNEITCTNVFTGQTEVVGVIDTGNTTKVTWDLERFLPEAGLSLLMELIRKNCGLRIYIARADICIDPFNPNDYNALEIFGEVRFGDYNRSEMIFRNKGDAGAIMESTTVTAYQWIQWGDHTLATRGGLNTAPIVDIALCDKKQCGGKCAGDSDGCQRWYWVDETGVVGWTDDQFKTENVLAVIPSLNFTAPPRTICCGPRGRIIVTDASGNVFITTVDDITDDNATTWTEILVDVDGNDLEPMNDCYSSPFETEVWYVGDTGTVYQYFVSTGVVVPVATIPGIINNFNALDKCGDDVLIGGDAATLLRATDGGRSFNLVEIIDPATGLPLDIGINITAVAILSTNNFAVGTSDDRVLYTLDGGLTWNNQLIFGGGGGTIKDLEYYVTSQGADIGWMLRIDENGKGRVYNTPFGSCSEWIEVPENPSEEISDNGGLCSIVICPDNPNITASVGTSDGGAGVIYLTNAKYL